MISQINVFEIVKGHLYTLGPQDINQADKLSATSCVVFFASGIPFALGQFLVVRKGYFIDAEIVGIVVSAASILAGLLLNLLVLIYSLAIQQESILKDSLKLFKRVTKHTFYNISFSILLSITLVISALTSLIDYTPIRIIGNLLTFYLGTLCIVSLLMVLRKCHKLISFYFK